MNEVSIHNFTYLLSLRSIITVCIKHFSSTNTTIFPHCQVHAHRTPSHAHSVQRHSTLQHQHPFSAGGDQAFQPWAMALLLALSRRIASKWDGCCASLIRIVRLEMEFGGLTRCWVMMCGFRKSRICKCQLWRRIPAPSILECSITCTDRPLGSR